jgi:hypothetical protein
LEEVVRPSRLSSKGRLLPTFRRFFKTLGPEGQIGAEWFALRVAELRARGVVVEVIGPVGVGVLVHLEFGDGSETMVRLLP